MEKTTPMKVSDEILISSDIPVNHVTKEAFVDSTGILGGILMGEYAGFIVTQNPLFFFGMVLTIFAILTIGIIGLMIFLIIVAERIKKSKNGE